MNDYVLRVIRVHINVYVENVDLIRRLNQRQESIKTVSYTHLDWKLLCFNGLKIKKVAGEKKYSPATLSLMNKSQFFLTILTII